MTHTIKPVFIQTKTNLHVGNGATNIGIVDNRVQRDSISNLPIINASSLKGALRDFIFTNEPELIDETTKTTEKMTPEAYNFIFGTEAEQQGILKFLDTYLLFLPLRSNKAPYFYATSKQTLLAFVTFYETLGFPLENNEALKEGIGNLEENTVEIENNQQAYVEDFECQSSDKIKPLKDLLPPFLQHTPIAILSEENFIDAISNLPIIARNKLKEKVSENLWYEEVVPRQSVFYTAFLSPNNYGKRAKGSYENGLKAFYKILNRNRIQIGANASVGYGVCQFNVEESE
jgi:CRISPR-associated protein Cmr4